MSGSGTLKALGNRSIIGAFNKRLEEVAMASWVNDIALQIDSNVETETIAFLSDTPAMKERLSNRPASTLRPFTFQITNKEWTAGMEVKSADLRRDKTGQILARARELGARAAQLPQSVLSAALNTNGNAFDGVAFFATSHTTLSGATINNDIDVAAATGTTPTIPETETGIMSGVESILGFPDDEGEPANEFAQSFLVMVPKNLWKQANSAVKNDFNAAAQSNTVKASGFNFRLVMNPRLTSSVFIYVFRMDSDVKSLVWQDEVLPVMRSLTDGSEYEILNSKHLYTAERTGNGGYGRFHQACRVEFT